MVTSGGSYTYDAGASKANDLAGGATPGFGFYLSEQSPAGDPITVSGTGAGTCMGSGTSTVSCSAEATSAVLDMGFENLPDTVTFSSQLSYIGFVNGGPGSDRISGTGELNGEAGDDVIEAYNTAGSTLNGGEGNDTLRNGEQSETFNGGSGVDTVDYANGQTVRASIDGVANDGAAGQTDNVALDVENLIGGPGNDILTGTSNGFNVANAITGGPGDDTIDGKDGNDVFVSGKGQDGTDTFAGGAGTDAINYGARSENLRVRLDGNANDGEAGESDNVATDVENVTGGYGDDFIGGQVNIVVNTFSGGPGEDDLHGGSGDDNLYGNPGNDVIDGAAGLDDILGEEGNDTIDGGLGNDAISGGDGFDVIDGGAGTDTVNGAAGADTLLARDGVAETVVCGTGVDSVDSDPGDTVNADCEHNDNSVHVAGGPTPSSAPAPAPAGAAPVAAPVTSERVSDGGASVTVSCRIAGRKRAARRVTCRVRLPRAQAGLRARLSRRGKVYAVGRAKAAARRQTLSLRSVRKAAPGRYTLALRDAAGRKVMAVTVFVK